jgi:hypothetical protein
LLPSTIRVKNNGGKFYSIALPMAMKIAKKLSNKSLNFIKIPLV